MPANKVEIHTIWNEIELATASPSARFSGPIDLRNEQRIDSLWYKITRGSSINDINFSWEAGILSAEHGDSIDGFEEDDVETPILNLNDSGLENKWQKFAFPSVLGPYVRFFVVSLTGVGTFSAYAVVRKKSG